MIKNYFQKQKKENYVSIVEKAHGTIERREYIFTNDTSWITNKDKWKDLKSIGIVIRQYINSEGKQCVDKRYFISNIDAVKIKIISKAIRDEWAVENKLHLYLDMVFLEDKNKCFLNNSQKKS